MAAITVQQALHLAAAQFQAGQLAAAESLCRSVLAAFPQHAGALHQLGTICITDGRYGEASDWLAQAIAQSPGEAHCLCDFGVSMRLQGKVKEAAQAFERAVALQSDLLEAHLNLVEALIALNRLEEAIVSGQQLIAKRPAESSPQLDAIFAEASNHLGNAFLQNRRVDEAIAAYENALRFNPDYADAWSNLGIACFRAQQLDRAEQAYRQAIALRPDFARAHINLSLLLLLLGRHAEGWREQEWRLANRAKPGPRWNGEPAPGRTLLVHAEHGFGDMLQFFRYLPLVKARSSARVILLCQRELVRLLAASDCGVEIVANEAGAAVPSFDLQVPLLSLPLTLNRFDPWHPDSAYLSASSESRASWRKRLGRRTGLRVGLVWAGNRAHGDDAFRSLTFEQMRPLLRLPKIKFYRLQIAAAGTDPAPITEKKLIDLTEHITDFADTAALLAELDLVISVDTSTAHLAGALGRPVWTLLPTAPDWRWGLEGDATLWYPTMRLFRQTTPGAWEEVIQRVAEELRRASSKPETGPQTAK